MNNPVLLLQEITCSRPLQDDPFTIYASHIALSHNAFIRGFNSIYQQAPNLTPSDYKDFIGYCIAWYTCVGENHTSAEIKMFAALEEAIGESRIMDHEVTLHSE